jgi:hypothetical protein
MEVKGQLHAPATFSWGKRPLCWLCRKLILLQSRPGHCGEETNFLLLPGIEPRPIFGQPVFSHGVNFTCFGVLYYVLGKIAVMPYSLVVANVSGKSTASIVMVEQWLPSGTVNFCWASSAQSFLVSDPVGTHNHVFTLSRLLRVLKWGLRFDERRGLTTYYWSLRLHWGSVWQWLPF